MTRFNALLAIVLFCMHTGSRGDSCPSPEIILNRDLSKQYEWTVDENTTLQDLLSVKQFTEARIMDNGSFVSCYYTAEKGTVRLDAATVKGECSLTLHTDKWTRTDAAQDVCTDTDADNCGFTYSCEPEK